MSRVGDGLSRFSTCETKLTASGTEDFWLIVALTGVSSFRDRRPTGRRRSEEGVDGTAVILLRLMLDGVISAEQIERARD